MIENKERNKRKPYRARYEDPAPSVTLAFGSLREGAAARARLGESALRKALQSHKPREAQAPSVTLRVPPPSRREASPLRHALRATSPEARGMRFAPPRPSGGFLLSSLAHRRAGACSRRSIRNRIYIIQLDCSTIKHTVSHDSCHIVLQRQGGGSKPPPYNLELYPAPSGRGLPRGRGWGRVR